MKDAVCVLFVHLVNEGLLWRETELGGVYWNLVLSCRKWLRGLRVVREGESLTFTMDKTNMWLSSKLLSYLYLSFRAGCQTANGKKKVRDSKRKRIRALPRHLAFRDELLYTQRPPCPPRQRQQTGYLLNHGNISWLEGTPTHTVTVFLIH